MSEFHEIDIQLKPNRGIQSKVYNYVVRFLSFYYNVMFDKNNPAPTLKVYLSGGLGSGKTFTGSWLVVIFVFWIKSKFPNESTYDFLCFAPTYDLAIRVCCKTLRKSLVDQGFRPGKDFRYIKNEKSVIIDGNITFRFITAEDPENIAGDNVFGIWGDEIYLMKAEALKRAKARNRYGGVRVPKFAIFTGTPEVGDTEVAEHISDFRHFLMPTIENEEHVGPDYILDLKKSFTEEEQRCYIYGETVKITSESVFWAFSRDKNVIPDEVVRRHKYDNIYTDRDLFVGMDFNVNPFVASLFQKHHVPYLETTVGEGEYKEAYIMKKVISLKNLMIDDMIDAIELEYFSKGGRKNIICSPDSNKGRDTGTPYSPFDDQAIEYTKMENRPGWILIKEPHNPRVYLSCNVMNNQFQKQSILFIKNESTKQTINIFDTIKWIQGKQDKMDESIKHYIDAPRYFSWSRYNPINGVERNNRNRTKRRFNSGSR